MAETSEYLSESELQRLAGTIPTWTRVSTSENRESYTGHPPVENTSLSVSHSKTRANEKYTLTAQVTQPPLLLGECYGKTAKIVFDSVQQRCPQEKIAEPNRNDNSGLWVRQPKLQDIRALLGKQR